MRNRIKNSILKLIALILIMMSPLTTILILSCHDNPVDPKPIICNKEKVAEFEPNSLGTWWEYYREYYPNHQDTLIYAITKEHEIMFENEMYSTHVGSFVPSSGGSEFLSWNGPDGLYNLGFISEYDTLIFKAIYFKYPVSPGESWLVPNIGTDYNGKFYIDDSTLMSCVDTNVQVITEIDTFSTVIYSYETKLDDVATPHVHSYSYTPGIGLIKKVIKNKGSTETLSTLILQDYCIQQ